MPERWEREVEKLEMLTAPQPTRTRITERPHGEWMAPRPRRSQRVAATVVALAVFALAAALVAGAFRRSGSGAVEIVGAASSPASSTSATPVRAVLNSPADGSMPRLTLSVNGETATFDARDGRWPGATLAPSPIQTFDATIDPGAPLTITGDAAKVEGSLWIADHDQNLTGQSLPLDPSSGSAALPGEPGIYRLTIVGTWPDGEAGFSVGITIGTPPSDWPPPPPIVTVPDVIGLTRSDAVARLTDVGFVSVSVATPTGQAGGVVTSEDPVPGTQTKTTTTIGLTVSASG